MALLVIILLALITVFSVVYLALTVSLLEDTIPIRLRAINDLVQGCSNITATLARPFKQRIAFPQVGEIASKLNRYKPQTIRRFAQEKIEGAAGFGRRNARNFLLLCGVLVCGLPVVIRKIFTRKASMRKALPDVLDQLIVSVEAGLDFDAAVAKLAEQIQGPLADEFMRLLQDIHMGIPRQQALQAMGTRCGVDEVSLLITALIQADQLGESIGNVLRVQSNAIREQRRQRAEEKAQKAAILFLLVLWTLAAIFVVLLVLR